MITFFKSLSSQIKATEPKAKEQIFLPDIYFIPRGKNPLTMMSSNF